ncbi:Transposon Ty3-G Gag-Pol polyprotein [Smittium culicis]|uniref:Transposon Ty3-G Gag-Pol polyprotein n=1 Tax=Smittium culicis TaxID=133412 RepID=A0A1R1XQY2_9FUNG|nr:Transposon Ty3-G Gag-Pol polyprotein [Smittium culicis]
MYSFLGISHRSTTAYRPQSKGQVGRFNQSLKKVLSKVCRMNIRNWECYFWKAMLTLRNTKHRITKKSPAELLLGFTPTIPLSWRTIDTNEKFDRKITIY